MEHYVGGSDTDYRMAVLHCANSVELAAKAVLVKNNHPIFESPGKSITSHKAMEQLATVWGVPRVPWLARLQVLIDERNAIQHRYGTLDDVTMDYHMNGTTAFLQEVLTREFSTDIHELSRQALPEDVWNKCRFIMSEKDQTFERVLANVHNQPETSFLTAMEMYTSIIDLAVADIGVPPATHLDVVIKFHAALPNKSKVSQREVRDIPGLFSLRNGIIHIGKTTTPEEVEAAIRLIQKSIDDIENQQYKELFRKALEASNKKVRGTNLLEDS